MPRTWLTLLCASRFLASFGRLLKSMELLKPCQASLWRGLFRWHITVFFFVSGHLMCLSQSQSNIALSWVCLYKRNDKHAGQLLWTHSNDQEAAAWLQNAFEVPCVQTRVRQYWCNITTSNNECLFHFHIKCVLLFKLQDAVVHLHRTWLWAVFRGFYWVLDPIKCQCFFSL